jgi:hypothetical protein
LPYTPLSGARRAGRIVRAGRRTSAVDRRRAPTRGRLDIGGRRATGFVARVLGGPGCATSIMEHRGGSDHEQRQGRRETDRLIARLRRDAAVRDAQLSHLQARLAEAEHERMTCARSVTR